MGRLPRAMENRALRPALRAGGNVVKLQAIANVKRLAVGGYSKGLLARSIVLRAARQKKGQLRLLVAIAPTVKSAAGVRVGLYGSVFELGRQAGHGGNRNTQKPQPYLRPAAKQSATKVYSVVTTIGRNNLAAAVEQARG